MARYAASSPPRETVLRPRASRMRNMGDETKPPVRSGPAAAIRGYGWLDNVRKRRQQAAESEQRQADFAAEIHRKIEEMGREG